MRLSFKRAIASMAGLAAAASLVPILAASPAGAAPSPQNPGATISPSSGNSATSFSVNVPAGATCPGDSANDGWRVTSYMVPASVNPSTLTFDSNGPIPNTFGTPGNTQADFRQPLYTATGGSPYTAGQTANAATPPGPGPIINIPAFSFGAFGDVPSGFGIYPGEYNVGIACIVPTPGGAAIDKYWNKTITVTNNPGDTGPAGIAWSVGTAPQPPTGLAATPQNQACQVSFTPGAADPAATSYTATANPGGFTATGAGSPLTITGLTNNTAYNITVTATNSVGTSSPSSAVSCTPNAGPRTNVTGLAVTPGAPGSGNATVTWTQPAANTPPALPTGCLVSVTGPTTSSQTVPCADETASLTGLQPGNYTVTVTAQYADAPTTGTPPASAAFTINPAAVLYQNIDVTRPVGALVITQVCGTNGAHDPVPAGSVFGFDNGLGAESAATPSIVGAPTNGGTAPELDGGTPAFPGLGDPNGVPDPAFAEYPLPTDVDGNPAPNYATNCGFDLGVAEYVTDGPGSGQFFAADGVIDQITVVDTRDDDDGWDVTGTMSTFYANAGQDTFSGSQMGWIPKPIVDGVTDTGPITFSDGSTYDQDADAGAVVAPNTPNATGLSSGRILATAPAGDGLGTAILDARLLLLIPVTADAGDYTGTLTITAA